jgi:uncharacterized protein YecT (DUF1311 family)
LIVLLTLTLFGGSFVVGAERHDPRVTPIRASLVSSKSGPVLPVLREDFTLLPCSRNSTLGLEGCAEHHILSLDAEVNSLRGKIFELLYDAAARRHFVVAENDWYRYRQSACISESDVNEGGSLEPVDFALCVARLDQQHVATLKALESLYHPDASS